MGWGPETEAEPIRQRQQRGRHVAHVFLDGGGGGGFGGGGAGTFAGRLGPPPVRSSALRGGGILFSGELEGSPRTPHVRPVADPNLCVHGRRGPLELPHELPVATPNLGVRGPGRVHAEPELPPFGFEDVALPLFVELNTAILVA